MRNSASELENSVPRGCDGAYRNLIETSLLCFPLHPAPFMDRISRSVQQPCKKTSLWQVGVRRDGRMSPETEGEHDKNREQSSSGPAREGRSGAWGSRRKNTKLFPNPPEGPAGSVLQPSDPRRYFQTTQTHRRKGPSGGA